jgi:hypothetical protein
MASATLQSLPLDIFQHHLLSYLTYTDVCNLGATSKSLHSTIATQSTWTAFLRHHQYVDITQHAPLSALPLRLRAAIGRKADLGWEDHTFKLNSLFPQRWQRNCLPRLEISTEVIAVGVGADLHIHWIPNHRKDMFRKQDNRGEYWRLYNLGMHGREDITEILAIPGRSTEFIISQANGFIRHFKLSMEDNTFEVKRTFQHQRAIIRSLASTDEYLVALSSTSPSTHQISFYPLNQTDEDGSTLSPSITPVHTESPPMTEPWQSFRRENHLVVTPDFTTDYPTRPWQSVFLNQTTLALGSTTPSALTIYHFRPDSKTPMTELRQLVSHGAKLSGLPDVAPLNKTSIYALHKYSPSLLLSGWYHGPANLHDLRSPSAYPAIALNDPLDDGAAYSISTDGSHRVLVGGSQHGLIKIFDLRMPGYGWSIYPGRERSPVFAIRGEHTRIFAATEGMLWECDLSAKCTRRHDYRDWRSKGNRGRGWGFGWDRGARAESLGGHVRLHYGPEKLYREDGSEIGKAPTMGVMAV